MVRIGLSTDRSPTRCQALGWRAWRSQHCIITPYASPQLRLTAQNPGCYCSPVFNKSDLNLAAASLEPLVSRVSLREGLLVVVADARGCLLLRPVHVSVSPRPMVEVEMTREVNVATNWEC